MFTLYKECNKDKKVYNCKSCNPYITKTCEGCKEFIEIFYCNECEHDLKQLSDSENCCRNCDKCDYRGKCMDIYKIIHCYNRNHFHNNHTIDCKECAYENVCRIFNSVLNKDI